MGEPNTGILYYPQCGRKHCELKYLSSNGKEIKWDSLSSDERNGKSPNHNSVEVAFGIMGFGKTLGEANKPNIEYYN